MTVLQANNSRAVLENFPVFKQQTPYTCGPTSVRMVLKYLGHDVEEAHIARRCRTHSKFGTMPFLLTRAFRQYLRELEPDLKLKILNGQAVNTWTLIDSISAGFPVIATFITRNHFRPHNLVGHYSVVYGVDSDDDEILMSNAFGYKENVPMEDFWRIMEFVPLEDKQPIIFKLIMKAGILKPRNIITLERRA